MNSNFIYFSILLNKGWLDSTFKINTNSKKMLVPFINIIPKHACKTTQKMLLSFIELFLYNNEQHMTSYSNRVQLSKKIIQLINLFFYYDEPNNK